MSDRRKYTAQLKADAVGLVINSGRSVVDCSNGLGINEDTLGNWVRAWRAEHPEQASEEHSSVEWAANQGLQAESAELKRQNAFVRNSVSCVRDCVAFVGFD